VDSQWPVVSEYDQFESLDSGLAATSAYAWVESLDSRLATLLGQPVESENQEFESDHEVRMGALQGWVEDFMHVQSGDDATWMNASLLRIARRPGWGRRRKWKPWRWDLDHIGKDARSHTATSRSRNGTVWISALDDLLTELDTPEFDERDTLGNEDALSLPVASRPSSHHPSRPQIREALATPSVSLKELQDALAEAKDDDAFDMALNNIGHTTSNKSFAERVQDIENGLRSCSENSAMEDSNSSDGECSLLMDSVYVLLTDASWLHVLQEVISEPTDSHDNELTQDSHDDLVHASRWDRRRRWKPRRRWRRWLREPTDSHDDELTKDSHDNGAVGAEFFRYGRQVR